MANIAWDGGTDNVANTAANWLGDATPGADDTAIIPAYSDGGDDTITGIAAFPASNQIVAMKIEEGGSYTIGSRLVPLGIIFHTTTVTTSDLDIGGTGIYFLTPHDYDTITITEAGSAPGDGQYACNLTAMTHLGTGAAIGAIHVNCESNMSVGIGAENGTATDVETIVVTGGDVTIGSGCVDRAGTGDPDLTVRGGNVTSYCDLDTVLVTGGTLTIADGAITTSLTIEGGTVNYDSDGTCAACTVNDSGILNFSADDSLRILSTCDLYAGATLIDPNETVTYAAGIDLNQCRIEDVTLEIGRNFGITKAAVTA